MAKQLKLSFNLLQFEKTTTAQAWICSIIANMMTESQELYDTQECFNRWDSNGDGFLTPDEIEENMVEISKHFKMAQPNVRKMIKAADINGDGKIDYTEFVAAAYDKRKLLDESNLRRAFNRLDAARTGKISKNDIRKILIVGGHNMGDAGKICRQLFQKIDREHDEFMTFEEFKCHMQNIKNTRGGNLFNNNRTI